MVQPRLEPFRYSGPFRGLNTTQTARELGPQFAAVARNVILSEGRIRPRAPFERVAECGIPRADHLVTGMLQYSRRDGSVALLAKTWEEVESAPGKAEIWLGQEGSSQVLTAELLETRTGGPGVCWALPDNGYVYILQGDGRIWKTNGTAEGTLLAGITPPMAAQLWLRVHTTATQRGLGQDVYEYACSYYDSVRDVESNRQTRGIVDYSGTLTGPDAAMRVDGTDYTLNNGARVLVTHYGNPRAQEGVTHLRVYRKNVTTGETFYRLVLQMPADRGAEAWDPGAEELSTETGGPMSPVKNGIPRDASVAAWYNDRMFYNSTLPGEGHLLRFSAQGRPDHVDPDDTLPLAGDELGGITGMAVISGQLAILKRRSIWILSGPIAASTNLTIGFAAMPPESAHTLYRTKAKVGCANTRGGNGAIVCGDPGLVFFNSESGFYAFDGIEERHVSKWIKPTWREFVRNPRADDGQAVTYAIDPYNEILYLCQAEQGAEAFILAYHYGLRGPDGLGAWTIIDCPELTGSPTAAASNLGAKDYALAAPGAGSLPRVYSSLMIGTSRAEVYEGNDRDLGTMPPFAYETGRLHLAEGFLKHIYALKWFHGQPPAAGDGSPRKMRFGFRAGPESAATMVTRDVAAGTYSRQPVRREVNDITLLVEQDPADPTVKWDREYGLIGWALDAELAGQR